MALNSVNYPLIHNANPGEYNIKENLDASGTEQVQVYRGQIYDFGDESYPIDIAEIAKHYITLDDIDVDIAKLSGLNILNVIDRSLGYRGSFTNGMYFLHNGGTTRQYGPSAYSNDGVNYFATSRGTSDFNSANSSVSRVAYLNGRYFFPTGQNVTALMTSTNGISWSIISDKLLTVKFAVAGLTRMLISSNLGDISIYNSSGTLLHSQRLVVGSVNSYYPIFDGIRFIVVLNTGGAGQVWSATDANSTSWSQIGSAPFLFYGINILGNGYLALSLSSPIATIYRTDNFNTYTIAYQFTYSSILDSHSDGKTCAISYTSDQNRIIYTTNGVTFFTYTMPAGYVANTIQVDGDRILIWGINNNEVFTAWIALGSQDDIIITDQVKDIYIDNNSATYPMAYDYNTRYISSIGSVSNRNESITGEVIEGQNLFFSLYDEQWGRSKEITESINGTTVASRTTDARCSHAIFTVPELDKGDTLTLESTVSGEIMVNEYKVIDDCHIRYIVYYVNKLGGIDSLLIKGNTVESYNNDEYQINGIYNRSTPSDHQRRTIQNTTERRWQMNTGLLTDEQASRIDHLLLSPKLWVNDLEEGLIFAANILDNAFSTAKFRDNTRFVSYTFNLVQSQDIIRRG